MPTVFTATCKRDAARFAICARTQERYLGWAHEAAGHLNDLPRIEESVVQTCFTPWHELGLQERSPYYLQQLTKLYCDAISLSNGDGVFFHVDSDMWFDDSSSNSVVGNEGLWVYDEQPALLNVWPIQAAWAAGASWLLGKEVTQRSYMMETRGWWLRRDVLEALRARIFKVHGVHLRELAPFSDVSAFSEYQLYAAFAWHFAREAHEWVDKRDLPIVKHETVGRDMQLFVPHWSSADAPTPAVEARWVELLS